MNRPLMAFDGDCGFCRAWIARWREITGDRVDYKPYQEVARDLPQIPVTAFAAAVHLLEPDGRISRGAEAVFRSLAIGGLRWPLRAYEWSATVRRVTEAAYAFVARNRSLFNSTVMEESGPIMASRSLTTLRSSGALSHRSGRYGRTGPR